MYIGILVPCTVNILGDIRKNSISIQISRLKSTLKSLAHT